MSVIVISVAYRDTDICAATYKMFFLCIVMPPKRNRPVAQAKRGRPKNEDDEHKQASTALSTPVTKKTNIEDDHPTVLTAASFMSNTTASTMSPPSFRSPGSSVGRALNFKDMVDLDKKYVDEKKFVMAFDGWDDYQKLVNAVKHIFPGMKSSTIRGMSYDQLIDYLFVFLDIEEGKSLFFDFAVNKRGRPSLEVYQKLKNLDSAIDLSNEFVSFVHELLDEKDKVVYVKNEYNTYNSIKTIDEEIQASGPRRAQPKRAAKKDMLLSEDVIVEKVEIKQEKTEKVVENKCVPDKAGAIDIDPMNESVYSDVVSHTRKQVTVAKGKKCIQVFVSKAFRHKNEEKAVVYAVMINFRDCIWYMHSDFLVSCLESMEKTELFEKEYGDVDMSWIDQFTDFSVRAVEHGADAYKKTKNQKTLEMVLLPVIIYKESEVTIEDQILFVFEDVLRRFFRKYKVERVSRGKMLLDFLEAKQQSKFLNFLLQSKGKGNRTFTEECITEELNNAFFTLPIQYNYEVALDKFMMDADIKLFLMSHGYKSFEELTDEEVQACFEYAGKKNYVVPKWGEIRKKPYND